MELSYAQLVLIEEALGELFDYQLADWISCSNNEISLSKDDVARLVTQLAHHRAEASWRESPLSSVV